jgi:hypothetical protein
MTICPDQYTLTTSRVDCENYGVFLYDHKNVVLSLSVGIDIEPP